MVTDAAPTVEQDQATRELAQSEFERPLVVEAGAGTGKTALLVARVASWCMGQGWELHDREDMAPEEVARRVIERVVAITFTEAAAAEMARKIGEAFSTLAEGREPIGWKPDPFAVPEDPDDSIARAGFLSGEAHRLGVSTIHSFCQRLLSTYPLEAGLHPRFVVDAEEEAVGALVVEVVEETLRSLDENPLRPEWDALAEAGIDPRQIGETLQYLVTEGMGASDFELDPFEGDSARVEGAELTIAVTDFLAAESGLLDGLPKNSSVSILARDVVRELGIKVEGLGEVPDFSEVAALAHGCGSKALKKITEWGTKGFGAKEIKCLGDAEAAAKVAAVDLSQVLNRLAVLRPSEFNSARRLLLPLVREVEERRMARGIVSFSDLLFRAARLVESSPAVVREVCSEIDQLLVDEFQDTDAVQCRLIKNLAFGEKRPGLFVVGDPKQSIYAWRNADLAAYQSFVATVQGYGGGRYPLVQNFRSVEPILNEVGRVIEEIMIEEDDVQPPFVPLRATEDRIGAPGFNRGQRTAVEHWVAWPPDPDGGPPAKSSSRKTTAFEAEAIARDIQELGRNEGVRWGDMAILLRATTAQEDLLEAFRKRSIPYEVAREKEFYKQREVVEAAALVRCVIDPADILALLTVLRSDVVGVPDVALAPLWRNGFPDLMAGLGRLDGVDLESIEGCVTAAAATTPKDPPGAGLLGRWPVALVGAARVIQELRNAYATDPPDLFVERIRMTWLAEVSAAARFLGRFRRARLDRFFSDLERRMASGDGGVASLARYLRQAVKEGQSGVVTGEPDLQADAVHVMTIHGAKGLDFSHVYLVQTHRGSPGGTNKPEPKVLPLKGAREYRIFGWPTPGFAEAEELKKRQSNAEMIRLLYVATTRAKDRLVVSGGWNTAPGKKGPLEANSFADLLDHRIDESTLEEQRSSGVLRRVEEGRHIQWFMPAHRRDDEEDGARELTIDQGLKDVAAVRREAGDLAVAREAAEERMSRPLTGGASSMELEVTDQYDSEEDGPVPVIDHDRGAARVVGTIIHRMLEKIDPGGDLEAQLGQMLEETWAELDSLDEGAAAVAGSRLKEILDGLAGGRCLSVLASVAGTILGREIAIVAPPQEDLGPTGAITGFVDLVYRDPEDGRIVVADYKTDAVADEGAVAERVRVYEPQVRTYGLALREALGLDHEPHVELWFLAADRIVRL